VGFLDKVKAQATVLADKAQTGVQQGQTKLQEMQSGKQADHLLRDLGAYVFLSERGRNQPDSEAKVAGLMAQLDALEAAGTPVAITDESAPAPQGGAVPQSGASAPPPPPPPPPAPPPQAPAGGGLPPTDGGTPSTGGGAIPQSGSGLPG
jgi:hypothetical protein